MRKYSWQSLLAELCLQQRPLRAKYFSGTREKRMGNQTKYVVSTLLAQALGKRTPAVHAVGVRSTARALRLLSPNYSNEGMLYRPPSAFFQKNSSSFRTFFSIVRNHFIIDCTYANNYMYVLVYNSIYNIYNFCSLSECLFL